MEEKESRRPVRPAPGAGRKPKAGPAAASILSADDLHLFNEGTHTRLYEKLGSHRIRRDRDEGVNFAVWAPDAESVSVIGDFNGWDPGKNRLDPRGTSGIWETWVAGAGPGVRYKYHVRSRHRGYRVDKADPFAFHHETPPATGSVVWSLDYEWGDDEWMGERAGRNGLESPMSIYEIHLGSWMKSGAAGRMYPTYRELATRLVPYLLDAGFTHVEFLPIMEHPFHGSWGYQTTGHFAPTSRHGTPQDLMFLIDSLHRNGIGVILDWVPSHFPADEHGLAYFDGSNLFEHSDPRQGRHPDWDTLIYNYGRREVRSFLASAAHFWLDRYHVDGLRVDAVASMLYLDYSRREGEWIPNRYGGRENLEAIAFLRQLNESVYRDHPGTQMMAEESTAWPMVSRPTYVGGLGFGMKWDMGWMHDTLEYFSRDPVHRKFHHNQLTFRMIYAFSENFVLPLSHDEVVHGKGSLLGKMPGDVWQKFANLRLLLGNQYAQPGKKLLFMGGEFGQWREWNHDAGLDWELLDQPAHAGVRRWVADLNRTYRGEPALYGGDCRSDGFEWVDCNDSQNSILVFLRRGGPADRPILVACNYTPVPRHNYRAGVPCGGRWREILNSDAKMYGGSGQGNLGGLEAAPVGFHGRKHSLNLTLPPLGVVFLQPESPAEASGE